MSHPSSLPLHRCTVKDNILTTPETIILTCHLPSEYHFSAGQYAYLQAAGMDAPRPYSIASPEYSTDISFHIKKSLHSTTTDAFFNLRAGDCLDISHAQGKSKLDKDNPRMLVALAGGVGIAPIHAIIMTALAHQAERKVHLYWGCNTVSELYLHDHFAALAETSPHFSYTPVIQTPHEQMSVGVVGEHLVHAAHDLHQADIHMAGPKNMMVHTLKMLEGQGIPEDKIHFDKFW